MRIDIVSVFPEYFQMLELSLMGKAQAHGLLSIQAHNLRDWTHDAHHSVDDTPVGGGAGMVMKPEVWAQCLDDLLSECESGKRGGHGDSAADDSTATTPQTTIIFPNPSAPLFQQCDATRLSRAERLIFCCGRYEGYDARVPQYYRERGVDVREYSIGDYVLNGGEAATAVMVEAIVRLMPGFMGNPESIVEESYTGAEALLEHSQYTKPASWRGLDVPSVLLSGDHGKVARYRRDEALARTSELRPDLIAVLDAKALDRADRAALIALGWEVSGAHPRKL